MKKGKKSAGENFREKSEIEIVKEVAQTEKRKSKYAPRRMIFEDPIYY